MEKTGMRIILKTKYATMGKELYIDNNNNLYVMFGQVYYSINELILSGYNVEHKNNI